MNTITINGKTIRANGNITITNNRVIVNGKAVSEYSDNVEIVINGNCGNIEDVAGNITIQGNCESIEDVMGNIRIGGDVKGDISDITGNIRK